MTFTEEETSLIKSKFGTLSFSHRKPTLSSEDVTDLKKSCYEVLHMLNTLEKQLNEDDASEKKVFTLANFLDFLEKQSRPHVNSFVCTKFVCPWKESFTAEQEQDIVSFHLFHNSRCYSQILSLKR